MFPHAPSPHRVRRPRNGARACLSLLLILTVGAGCATTNGDTGTTHRSGTSEGNLAAETGLGIGSAVATILYAPVKIAYAITGGLFGAFAYAYSGGSTEVANGVIVPAVYGDYVLTPDHLRQPGTIEFFGRRPQDGYGSVGSRASDGSLPPVSAAASASCGSLTELPTVHFEFGRSALTRSGESTVDLVARRLRECPDLNVDIEAHADWVGDSRDNLSLSERRAEVVRRHLIERGIDGARLSWTGYGEERPVASNTTAAGRALNRRVELPVR